MGYFLWGLLGTSAIQLGLMFKYDINPVVGGLVGMVITTGSAAIFIAVTT